MFINPILPKTYSATSSLAAANIPTHAARFDSVSFGASSEESPEETERDQQAYKWLKRGLYTLLTLTIILLIESGMLLAQNTRRRELDELRAYSIATPVSDDISSLSDEYPNVYYDPDDETIQGLLPAVKQGFDIIFKRNPNLRDKFDGIERFCVTSDGNNPEAWKKFGLPPYLIEILSRVTDRGATSADKKFIGVTYEDITAFMEQTHEFCHTLLSDEDKEKYEEALNGDLEENLDKLKQLDAVSLPLGLPKWLQYAVIKHDLGLGYSLEYDYEPNQTKESFAVLASYLLLDKCGQENLGIYGDDDSLIYGIEISKGAKILREYFPRSCEFIGDFLANLGAQEVVDNP